MNDFTCRLWNMRPSSEINCPLTAFSCGFTAALSSRRCFFDRSFPFLKARIRALHSASNTSGPFVVLCFFFGFCVLFFFAAGACAGAGLRRFCRSPTTLQTSWPDGVLWFCFFFARGLVGCLCRALSCVPLDPQNCDITGRQAQAHAADVGGTQKGG